MMLIIFQPRHILKCFISLIPQQFSSKNGIVDV